MSENVVDYDEVLEHFDPVMGLEVHVELNTASKMFCGCATAFGAPPNTQTCPVCLALPGSLPVVNERAIEAAIRVGLALNCEIASWCRFARKNYFYPDMPKDYQISQYDEPIAFNGYVDLDVDGETVRVPIERAHMEEDTGKSLHVGGATGRIQGADYSLLDYNRAGVPLIEIVTKPITGTGAKAPAVAKAYVAFLRDVLRSLDVSDVRMEQGSLRCDANVSLMPKGDTVFGTRTETKNVNSLRSIERALTYEMTRQAAILLDGGTVKQETRHWHEDGGYTSPGRSKEEAEDYRYFPEPDLVPVAPAAEWVEELRHTIPEHPEVHRQRMQAAWGFTDLEMRDVVGASAVGLIEQTVAHGTAPQAARKWWLAELMRRANDAGVELEALAVSPAQVARVQALVEEGAITDKMAREVFDGVLAGEGEPDDVIEGRGLRVVNDEGALQEAVDRAIAANPAVADKIRDGKMQAAGALIGAVMKDMGGKADAAKVRELIVATLT